MYLHGLSKLMEARIEDLHREAWRQRLARAAAQVRRAAR